VHPFSPPLIARLQSPTCLRVPIAARIVIAYTIQPAGTLHRAAPCAPCECAAATCFFAVKTSPAKKSTCVVLCYAIDQTPSPRCPLQPTWWQATPSSLQPATSCIRAYPHSFFHSFSIRSRLCADGGNGRRRVLPRVARCCGSHGEIFNGFPCLLSANNQLDSERHASPPAATLLTSRVMLAVHDGALRCVLLIAA
jgi:hypothetical protein